AAQWKELAIRHLPNAVVREVQARADTVQYPAPDQLLHALRRFALIDLRRAAKQGELKLSADDGSHREELLSPRAQAFETTTDGLSHSLRKPDRRRLEPMPFVEGSHRLHGDEGV